MHVGGTLRKVQFLRVPLHTYNVMIAKINLAKSSSITRAFIIVANNSSKLTTSSRSFPSLLCSGAAVSCRLLTHSKINLHNNYTMNLPNCPDKI